VEPVKFTLRVALVLIWATRDYTKRIPERLSTDPDYATKLYDIIKEYKLTQYDTPAPATAPVAAKHTEAVKQGTFFIRSTTNPLGGIVATEAVLFVEDAFAELGGPQELENAKTNLISRLNSCGVPVTSEEADTLIRSAYQTAKNDFGVEISKAVTS